MTQAPLVVSEAASLGADRVGLLKAYRRMLLVRRFEEETSRLYRGGEIPGFVHVSIGQEASAVGACWHLREDDMITSTHRGHGHCLAKGLSAYEMFAELMARETGTCAGRGGSMHIADPQRGVLGANGIVAAGVPIATGAAAAADLRQDGRVTVAFFGDGAVAQGAFYEAVNLAAVWRLPVIFFCENNHYAEFSAARDQHPVTLRERAKGYGLPFFHVPGNDVAEVADLMGRLVDLVRAGDGPVMVEAETYRWHGHYEGDPQRYRNEDELTEWKLRDPLVLARIRLDELGVGAPEVLRVELSVETEIANAVAAARSAPPPSPSSLTSFVESPRPAIAEPAAYGGSEVFRGMDAVREALAYELSADPDVFLAGIDLVAGNVFNVTRGLAAQFPGRVKDTPISETAIVGLAVGAALAGMRPVVELMYLDFVGVCLDQLLNQAAKLRFMTGGRARLPLVVRTQFGAGQSAGSQHSQSLEVLLAHIPGLTVVMPSTPADTYGLLRSAIRDDNPVVFIENRHLYGVTGPRPPADHLVPLGKAAVIRQGTDVTLVSISRMVHDCLEVASGLAAEGVDVEVIDLRTVAPLDMETVLASVARTSRLVVAHEAGREFGFGAEIAARVADEGFWTLDAPVGRVGTPRVPPPYAPELERAWLPGPSAIRDAVLKAVRV